MLSPKRVKFRKMFKGRTNGLATRGAEISFGHFGLQALAAREYPRLGQCLRVGGVGRHPLLLLGLGQLSPAGLVHIKHQHVLHVWSPSWLAGGRRAPPAQ